MKRTTMFEVLSLSCLLALPALAADGSGAHGGDGRSVTDNGPKASGTFILDLKKSVRSYLVSLQNKKDRLMPGALNYEFGILTSPELLADVDATGPYKFTEKRGGCGLQKDGFPMTASTRNYVPGDDVCVDLATVRDLGLTASQLGGILVHEHIRHIRGDLDDNHLYARAVEDTYWEAQTEPTKGECFVLKSGGLFPAETANFNFTPVDLVLKGQVIRKTLLGEQVSLSAKLADDSSPGYKMDVVVTLSMNGRTWEYAVPAWHVEGEYSPFWRYADFDLNVMPYDETFLERRTTLSCYTYSSYANSRPLAPFQDAGDR